MPKRQAACSCGQLWLVAEGEPVRVSICHCLACQRRTGSAFGYQARFVREHVQIGGRHETFVRVSDDGEERTFSFCPACGATVYWLDSSTPHLVAVPVGAFADPAFPPPDFSVWESRRHDWVAVPPEVEHEA